MARKKKFTIKGASEKEILAELAKHAIADQQFKAAMEDYREDLKLYNERKKNHTPSYWDRVPVKPDKSEFEVSELYVDAECYIRADSGNPMLLEDCVSLELAEMPGNCGTQVFVEFPYEKKLTEVQRLSLAAILKHAGSLGLSLASLNQAQSGCIPVLKDCGWALLAKFNNPNSGNNCVLFGRVDKKPKRQALGAVANNPAR